MKKVELLNLKGEKLKDINLNEERFGITPHKEVLTDAIILSRASLRQGTHKTKNRSEVSGGGRKPWRQKGTGHARQGSIRAIQFVGGATYGTPVPRDYSKKQNRKERKLALKSAYAHRALEKNLLVIDEIKFATPKTKEMVTLLKNLKLDNSKVLIIVKEYDENVILASRNLQNVAVAKANEVSVLDLISVNKILVEEKALEDIKEVLK